MGITLTRTRTLTPAHIGWGNSHTMQIHHHQHVVMSPEHLLDAREAKVKGLMRLGSNADPDPDPDPGPYLAGRPPRCPRMGMLVTMTHVHSHPAGGGRRLMPTCPAAGRRVWRWHLAIRDCLWSVRRSVTKLDPDAPEDELNDGV